MTLPPAPDREFGHYEVGPILGRGAIGTVYLARDRRIGRRVALKTIHAEALAFEDATAARDFYKRLQREAEVCGSLLHPNVVTLYEAGYDGDRVSYLAMEYVEGETLQSMIERLGRLPVEGALRIAREVLSGLEYAHSKGIIHRDIKPANVLIAHDQTAKIADFGISRPQQSSLTAAGSLMGTPNYVSPEQILGRTPTPRADLFSAGATLYEMLTGTKPFAAADVTGVLHNVLRLEVPHASDVNAAVPRPVGDFVARLLAKEPEARPSTSEALQELDRLLEPEATERMSAPSSLPANALRLAAAAGIAALLVVAVWVAVLTRLQRRDVAGTSFSGAQLEEFAQKRRGLEEAQQLMDAGRYQEAIQRYDAYLQKYPASTVARDARARAAAEMEKAATPKRKPRRRQSQDISPAELLRRLRKVFKP